MNRTCLVAALAATSLSAQITITDANMSVTSAPPATLSSTPRAMDLVSDALAIDQAFEHWWYFRVDGDSRETPLRSVGGFNEEVAPSGTHGDRDFDDLQARGLLKASHDLDTYSAGPASGVVISRLTVMNTSNGPLDIDIFGYTDVDIAGSFGNDVATGTLDSHFVTDPTGIQIEVRGIDADASEIGAYPTIRNDLADNNVDDLSNSAPPFSGDYTGAFQWTQTLDPFEERTFTIVIAVDTAAVAVPVVANYGAGNGDTFQIHATELPLQDLTQARIFNVRAKNALPNVPYRVITGLTPMAPYPFIPGIDLWVEPLSIVAVWDGLTTATGDIEQPFLIPPTAYLTGIAIYHQAFYVDVAAPNGFAFSTTALETRIGKL